jgi:ribosomal-protein-alanine N-acetyltransferase
MIRKAYKEDINSINELGSSFFDNFENKYNIKEYIDNNKYILLVCANNDVEGFILLYNNLDYYELEFIIVDVKKRKRGISKKLIDFFLDNYEKKDILLEVAVNNNIAIHLYQEYGFQVIGTRKKYYKDVDAYIMKRVVK